MAPDQPNRVERRLSAILAADVAGYSRLMHNDEEATHTCLIAFLLHAVEPAIVDHGGHDGVTENLTTDLSRIDGLFVTGRSSALSYKGKSSIVRDRRTAGTPIIVARTGNSANLDLKLTAFRRLPRVWPAANNNAVARSHVIGN
jgi:class 3 adenylate cyclase